MEVATRLSAFPRLSSPPQARRSLHVDQSFDETADANAACSFSTPFPDFAEGIARFWRNAAEFLIGTD